MRYTFEQIIEKPDKAVMQSTVDGLLYAAEKASKAEKNIEKRTGKSFSVLDAANLIVYERWGCWKNRNIGASRTAKNVFEDKVLLALKEQKLCESTKKNKNKLELNPLLNNSYFSTSLIFTPYAAFNYDIKSFNFNKFGIFLFCKLPGIRIDPKHNSFTNRIVNYDGVGEKYRDNIARALTYSYLGEVYQNQIEQAQLPELRGTAFGIIKFEEHLKRYNTTTLDSLHLSELLEESANEVSSLSEIILEHKYIKDIFDKVANEERSFFGKIFQKIIKKTVYIVDNHPLTEKFPIIGTIGRNMRSTASLDAYYLLDNSYSDSNVSLN